VLDSKHVLLTNISDAILNCPDYQKRNVTCVGFCKVSIPCRCSLTSVNFYLPARIEDCHKDRTTVTVLHTLNLTFLKHFFDNTQLADIYGDTLLPDPLDVKTPRLKILEANYSHELEIDKCARLDLARLVNLTKQDEEAYPSLAHSMVDDWKDFSSGSYDWSFPLFSWRSWILIILGLLAGGSFGFSLLLNQRLRTLTATVATLSLPSRTHALPTALNYFSSTTSVDSSPSIFVFEKQHIDWTLDISVIILLCIITFVTIAKICHGYKKHHYEFQLYVHIGCQNESVQIHVKTFKLHPEHYEFSAGKYVDSLHISRCLMPHLIIIWPSVRISSMMTNEQYQLPNSVPLTWTQAKFLRMALRKPYWCLFVTKVGETQSILSLPIRRNAGPTPSYGDVHEMSISTRTLYPSLGEPETKFLIFD